MLSVCVLVLLGMLLTVPAYGADTPCLRADSSLMRWVGEEGLTVYPADAVGLFTDGSTTFEQLFADIDRAERKVWVEFMIVANDSIGNCLVSHMAAAAQRGCDVRLIVDDYKSRERHYGYHLPARQDSIRALGIDLVLFDRFHYPWFNHVCRDHRKIVVIDDQIGYIGGLNVADYYIHGNPQYGGWRDTHARITGPAVEGLALLFSQHYRRYGGLRPHTFARYLYDPHFQPVLPSSASIVFFERSRVTTKLQSQTRRAIIAAFDAARDTIRFVTPYMLPTHTVRQAIIRAIDRGVHVEVLFSLVGDNPMLSYGNFNLARRLARHGAHVYLYRGAFHHSKVMMVDGQFSMVGSANLNSRSLKWDYEASCFIFSPDVTHRLDSIFQCDKLLSDTLSVQGYRHQFPRGQRVAGWWIDRVLTPFL